jgi:hypothetical protein
MIQEKYSQTWGLNESHLRKRKAMGCMNMNPTIVFMLAMSQALPAAHYSMNLSPHIQSAVWTNIQK